MLPPLLLLLIIADTLLPLLIRATLDAVAAAYFRLLYAPCRLRRRAAADMPRCRRLPFDIHTPDERC